MYVYLRIYIIRIEILCQKHFQSIKSLRENVE